MWHTWLDHEGLYHRLYLLGIWKGSTAITVAIYSFSFFQLHFVFQCRSGLKSPNGITPLAAMVCVNAHQLADTYSSDALNLPVLSRAAGRQALWQLPYIPLYRNQPANRHVWSMFPRYELMLPCCLNQVEKCSHNMCSIRPSRQNSCRGHPTAFGE